LARKLIVDLNLPPQLAHSSEPRVTLLVMHLPLAG